jgi:hypothetical protein
LAAIRFNVTAIKINFNFAVIWSQTTEHQHFRLHRMWAVGWSVLVEGILENQNLDKGILS